MGLKLMNNQWQLRFAQIGCVLLVIACFAGGEFLSARRVATIPIQLVIIVAAIWSAVAGFTLQKKLRETRIPGISKPSSKSTPSSRWKAGHVVRLWTATAVGLWGLVLILSGGSKVIADLLFGSSLAVLLIWKPNQAPEETPSANDTRRVGRTLLSDRNKHE